MDTGDKEPNGWLESAGWDPEKTVVHVKTISEIPDGYDAAGSGAQYIVDEPSPDDAREYAVKFF